jgi:hypothetical protein
MDFRNSSGSLTILAAIRRASSLVTSWPPAFAIIAERGPIWEEGHGMVQAENINSRCSSFQLADRSRRDHHSLAHSSKFPLSGTGTVNPNENRVRETTDPIFSLLDLALFLNAEQGL